MDVLSNSILGLIDIYNLLPVYIVASCTVKDFQGRLQAMMKNMAEDGEREWDTMYSPRMPLHQCRLRRLFEWNGGPRGTIHNQGTDDAPRANKKMRLFAF